ncbi:hypothetical protein quinque_008808 [Culex quinquefasciatus]
MRRRFVYVITMEQDQDGGKGHSDACSSRMVIAVIWSSRASAQRWPKEKVELRHQQTPDSLPTQITQTKVRIRTSKRRGSAAKVGGQA